MQQMVFTRWTRRLLRPTKRKRIFVLRSVVSDHEAVIELKLADRRSASDLRDTIYNQLVTRYMTAETSRSGCLLVTLAKDRNWKYPDSGTPIDLPELVSLLRDEAERVEEAMGGVVALSVHFLDLRPSPNGWRDQAECVS